MSNYLKRTPTSQGDTQVFTISCWIKNQSPGTNSSNILHAYNGSASNRFQFMIKDAARNLEFWSGGSSSRFAKVVSDKINSTGERCFRDSAQWMHVLAYMNVTAGDEAQRCKIYVNGVDQTLVDAPGSSVTGIPYNGNPSQVNNKLIHHIMGVANDESSDASGDGNKIQMFDYFFVDGQALEAEVFGFFKEGNGYQSEGTEKTPDFRSGQWSPRTPKSIKYEINRRGGFGENGFYLPLNDRVNPGADFHCAPNSIIKLKGEDLPQPRTGAPTTSLSFVDQLRQEEGTLGFDGSVKFDGSGDYLALANNADFSFDGDFTVEAFVYPTAINTFNTIFSTEDLDFKFTSTGVVRIYTTGGSNTTGTIPSNRWSHVALVRQGSTFTVYINGNGETVSPPAFTGDGSSAAEIGRKINNSSEEFTGFISNLRVVKGTAVYTADFTPSTEPLTEVTNTKLLCCNSIGSATAATVTPGPITVNGNAFATRNELTGSIILACPFIAGGLGENGGQNTTIPGLGDYHVALGGPSSIPAVNFTAGSGTQAKISGSKGMYYGSSLDVTNSNFRPRATVGTAFTLDGDYTVEFWAYLNDFSGEGSHLVQYDTDAGATGWCISADQGTARFFLRTSGGTDYNIAVSNVVPAGQWTHFAGVYEDDKDRLTLYVNGVAVGTTTTPSTYLSSQYTNLNRLHIGSNVGGGSRPMQGYIQDLRIYKGVAKYKSGFDVPNSWTPVGDFLTTSDTCKSNFATLSTEDKTTGGSLSKGNLRFTDSGSDGWDNARATIGVSKGKWYWEMRADGINQVMCASIIGPNGNDSTNGARLGELPGQSDDAGVTYYDDGKLYHAGNQNQGSAWGAVYGNGNIIGVAVDLDDAGGKVWFSRNGSWQASGNPSTGANPARSDLKTHADIWFPVSGTFFANTTQTFNFGQDATFANMAAVNRNRINNGTGNDVWHQSSNGGTHVDWTVTAGGTAMNVNVPNNNYARAWLLASDGTIDPKKTYLVSFYYASGPANLGVQNDQGYMTAIGGAVSPNGLSSGNHYSFILHGSREFNFTGFSGSNYSLENIVVSEIDEGYTDASGLGKFHYEPPTGFSALHTNNLDTPAISDPGEHFRCTVYKGTGSARGITGIGFKPDLVWCKSRTNNEGQILFDSPRGPESRHLVHTNTTEGTATGGLMSFDDDGFSVGQYTGTNQGGQYYAAWCWKGGGPTVPNTDGDITTQISVNKTAGFSTGTYSGNLQPNQGIGHGLGKVPSMVVVKERNANSGWAVYHKSRGYTKVLYWDSPDTEYTETGNGASWAQEPTSEVFYVGANGATNDNNLSFYAWAEVPGFSRFGSYIGNQTTNGPHIWCGFKPAYVMLKIVDPSSSARDWHVYDSVRNSTNPVGLNLRPSSFSVQANEPGLDFTSTGFKIRQNYIFSNGDGATIIYAAFAESPFQTANAK